MSSICDKQLISKIDISQTIKNGKKIFKQYIPPVQKRMKQLLLNNLNSASVVVFSGNSKNDNANEIRMIDRLSWNEDQIAKFIECIMNLEKENEKAGKFLQYKCFYGLSDREIMDKLNISSRTLRNYKAEAYYQIAVFANQVEFVYEKIYRFHLN